MWAKLLFKGPDAVEFLDGLVTNDLKKLAPGKPLHACLLTPQGHLRADFYLLPADGGVLMYTRPALAPIVKDQLAKYLTLSETVMADAPQAPDIPELTEEKRIASGLPAVGVDTDESTYPAEANLESAVSYDKGCYLGQETTARLKYKGKPHRRLAGLKLKGHAKPGDTVRAGERTVGKISSTADSMALALLPREDAEPGMKLLVGESQIPAEVFPFPSL